MKTLSFYGVLTAKEEFLYPDSNCDILPEQIDLAVAQNGVRGIQVLLKTKGESVKLKLESESYIPEWYRMQKIPVEYNTGDGEEQGGSMVLQTRPAQKPDYATRLAPFWVYDCLIPVEDGNLQISDGIAALYLCLCPKNKLSVGTHTARLTMQTIEGDYSCLITVRVYPVSIPNETFSISNWFSLDAISRFHQVPQNSNKFYTIVKKYALAMRRVRQTSFFLELDRTCVTSQTRYSFSFEYLRPLIEMFFSTGMQTLEIGSLLSRGFLPNGMPDMYTDNFKCAMAPHIPLDSPEGYAITVKFVQKLASFLKKYGWQERVIFHIHDEPDIHAKSEQTIRERRRQYYLAVSILRKYLPKVRIIEAVSTPDFYGGVDIWVPGTAGYEKQKERFDEMAQLGDEVWTYVCCGPQGHWLNRFLDFALLKNRLLFWGCSKNKLSGFLHWGFNQFPVGMNPYEGTSCPNHTGIGTNFPCGDSFIVYPGDEGPYISMRLEAQRRGAEDVELLNLLRQKNHIFYDELVQSVFINNSKYNDDPSNFEIVYENLLHALCE